VTWFSARNASLAAKDLAEGVTSVHIWATLGWQEIRQRYRRQKIGPFWLTISTGVMLGAMGPLYGRLFNLDISTYFAYLASGFVVWQLVAGTVSDSCQVFIATESIIKQIRLPLSIHVLRLVWRNLIVFAHNLIIVAAVLALYPPPKLGWHVLMLPFSLLVIAVNAVWVGIFLGMMCARFRDIPQIVTNLVQVFFFLTPVLWQPELLGRHTWAADINPFYHFLELVRAPLLGDGPSLKTWSAVVAMTLFGWSGTFLLFSRYRARIAYWV